MNEGYSLSVLTTLPSMQIVEKEISCRHHELFPMVLTELQKAEVEETLRNYGTACRKKDIRAILSLASPEISGFGSGPDEVVPDRRVFRGQIQRDLSQVTSVSLEYTGMKIFGEGRIAWVTTGCKYNFTVKPGLTQAMTGRMTIVLRNNGKRWMIEQMHFSMPYGEQVAGQSFPGV